jgi:hypothetical protein
MDIRYTYKYAPTLRAFSLDDTFMRAVKGPFGSGKSSAGVMQVVERGMAQAPGQDGVRRTRVGVVRNTYPQLLDTTIKTFHEWLPPEYFGDYKETPRPQYIIRNLKAPDGSKVEIEVLFRALDKPEHVKNLLSMEYTFVWFNEVREIAKLIWDNMAGRVNRYPSKKDGGATWSGIFADTNPCDTDHWFYKLFEEEKPIRCSTCKDLYGGWILYPTKDIHRNIIPIPDRRCPQCNADYSTAIPLTKIFHQPSGRSEQAENRPFLDQNYYNQILISGNPELIRVIVDGEYGSSYDGQPVYTNWSQAIHLVEGEISVVRGSPLIIGLDFGLDPAAVFCQYLQRGNFNVIDELVATNMDFREFLTTVLKPYIFSKYFGMPLIITGDPSGVSRAQSDGNTCFKELKAAKLSGVPAWSNSIQARLSAVNGFLTKSIPISNPKPGELPWRGALQVSGAKCPTIVRGFNGAYRRKRVAVANQDRYRDEPEKTPESHPHDALQYAAMIAETGKTVSTPYDQGVRKANQTAPPIGAYT